MPQMHSRYVWLAVILLASSYGAKARAIDDDDIDNSIEIPEENSALSTEGLPPQKNYRGLINDVAFFKTPPPKLIQKPGQVIEIVCEVAGKPLPKVEWVVGHYPIEEIESQESNVISESRAYAFGKVHAVHVIDYTLNNKQIYTCVGHGEYKTIYASTTVYPSKRHDLKEMMPTRDTKSLIKPRIIYSHRTHCDNIGTSIILPCKVHARPNAEVIWLDAKRNRIETNQRFKLLPTGDLLITELQWTDTGKFQCIARNSLGIDTAEVAVYTMANE